MKLRKEKGDQEELNMWFKIRRVDIKYGSKHVTYMARDSSGTIT